MQAIEILGTNIVLRWLQLEDIDPIIQFKKKLQHYPIDLKYISIVLKKTFRQHLKKGPIYTYIPTLAIASSLLELPQKYTNYTNVFLEEEAKCLPNKNARQYTIDLIEGQEPLYRPIYSLLEKELQVLQEYIDSSLQKGQIQ